MEETTAPQSLSIPVEAGEAKKPPLNLEGVRDLFFKPSRFFAERDLDWAPYYFVVFWIVGISSTIERIDKNMIRADFGSPRPGMEIVAESWLVFWLAAILIGIVGGALLWLIGGWWYRLRLKWSGADDVDLRKPRLVYMYASLVTALPGVIAALIATGLFEDYGAYWSSDEYWSALLILFPFWSVVVSYRGVLATFEVSRGRAQLWFLWLPVIVYTFSFGLVMFLYALL